MKKLSVVFRGIILGYLRKVCEREELFGDKGKYDKALIKASQKPFVVYAKKPFGSSAQVIKYLGRYTHRVGISEQRIVSIDDETVCFTWIDRTHGHKRKKMTLPLEAFINRFLMYLLPKGMRKIRYFGYMSNRDRQKSIEQVRRLIGTTVISYENPKEEIELDYHFPDSTKHVCEKCGREMTLWRTEDVAGTPSLEPGWLKLRLERRRLVHDPEPNIQKVL